MTDEAERIYREMLAKLVWRRVNDEPYEYAIRQGQHGDEFVKRLDGTCLRRRIIGQS